MRALPLQYSFWRVNIESSTEENFAVYAYKLLVTTITMYCTGTVPVVIALAGTLAGTNHTVQIRYPPVQVRATALAS